MGFLKTMAAKPSSSPMLLWRCAKCGRVFRRFGRKEVKHAVLFCGSCGAITELVQVKAAPLGQEKVVPFGQDPEYEVKVLSKSYSGKYPTCVLYDEDITYLSQQKEYYLREMTNVWPACDREKYENWPTSL